MWIGGFLIVGAAAHAAIFMVRAYTEAEKQNRFYIIALTQRNREDDR
jgi:photosystem I P700 chlorophyll a apoprotein A1